MQTRIKIENPRPIPWTPLETPLSECRVALVSSGGITRKTEALFDQDGERQSPWWGDPTFRLISREAKTEEIKLFHLHVDLCYAEADLNSLLPIDRMAELEKVREIGAVAPSHYPFTSRSCGCSCAGASLTEL